ncbi:hypothetical protein JKP88DRAFT_310385 [Tribonema minus]|uniref:Uncharacterized protein n=1 Tax=Tribonema minus TaxID=303371 RepID=A0A836CI71_9STRA|nr:hypothetical protein JKP88DRAFT_310385 [Tribonema minus]
MAAVTQSIAVGNPNVIIVGGGPAGLSAAVCLVLMAHVAAPSIAVLEARQQPPARTNFILLSAASVVRLRALGVEQLLVERRQLGPYDAFHLIDETANGRGCTCTTYPLSPHPIPVAGSLEPVDVDSVVEAQAMGVGIQSVRLMDLEAALRDRCAQLGVRLLPAARVVSIAKSSSSSSGSDTMYSVFLEGPPGKAAREVPCTGLIVVAEGAARRLIGRSSSGSSGSGSIDSHLTIGSKVTSPLEHHVRVDLETAVGPQIAVARLIADPDAADGVDHLSDASAPSLDDPNAHHQDGCAPRAQQQRGTLKRLLSGDAARGGPGIAFVQVPPRLATTTADGDLATGTEPPPADTPEQLHSEQLQPGAAELDAYARTAMADFAQRLGGGGGGGAALECAALRVARVARGTFAVQDCAAEATTAGANVALVGDCARAGHYFAGVGMGVAVVCDGDALAALARGVLGGGGDRRAALAAFERSMARTAEKVTAYNNIWWYDAVKVE